MESSRPVIGVILLTSLVSGCASRANFPDHPHDWVDVRTPLNLADTTSIARDYAEERTGRREPRIGLALSGGGTRAGMFAFGVLNGLNDVNVLDQVDIISSVSGGGYAAYWLFARRLEADQGGFDYRLAFADCRPDWWVRYDYKQDKGVNLALLEQGGLDRDKLGFWKMEPCSRSSSEDGQQWSGSDDRYRWQAHIARYPDVFRRDSVVFDGTNGGGPILTALPVMTLSFFEVLRFPFVSNGYLGSSYEKGISRTWGLTPLPRTKRADEKVDFSNADNDFLGGPYVKSKEHTWEALRQLDLKLRHSSQPLPLWVVNTTVLPKQVDPNTRAIFELTPLGYGSEASGYLSTAKYADVIPEIPSSVRASAAAADAQGLGTSHWRSAQRVSTLFPALRWGVGVNDHKFGSDVGSFRLSDGGGSDNMGLISLVRRGVRDIILVDAEADIEGRFEGVCWDREILNQAGYDLQFPMLERFSELCAQRISERDSNNSGGTATPRRAYNVSAWRNPIIKGEIAALDSKDSSHVLPPIRVWLVKLAWNQEKVHEALDARQCETEEHPVSCLLTVFHAHQPYTNTALEEYQMFPHLSTGGATWNSSTTLFWAWRELGRSAASLFEVTPAGLGIKSGARTPEMTPQPLLYRSPGRQAVSSAR